MNKEKVIRELKFTEEFLSEPYAPEYAVKHLRRALKYMGMEDRLPKPGEVWEIDGQFRFMVGHPGRIFSVSLDGKYFGTAGGQEPEYYVKAGYTFATRSLLEYFGRAS